MLVLTRKTGQQIRIGDNITLTIVKTQGQNVRVGIEAPRDVRIVRAELPPLSSKTQPRNSDAKRDTATRGLQVVRSDAGRSDRLPGQDAGGGQRHSQPHHPQRWTVASMRERVQEQTSPRSVTVAAGSAHHV